MLILKIKAVLNKYFLFLEEAFGTLKTAMLSVRLILSCLAVFAVCSFSFFLIHIVPGSPVDFILGEDASLEDKLRLQKQLGLDLSLARQYFLFLKGLLSGHLGMSLHSGRPVSYELLQALPASAALAFFALGWAALWGLSAGVFCVLKKGNWDRFFGFFSLSALSVPAFLSAPVFIWFFALKLSWLPVSEMGEGWGRLKHIILPSLSLALPLGAVLFKMSRTALLEVMSRNYMRTARAKGASFLRVGLTHGLKNAAVPIVTVLALQAGALLTGVVIVESIFDWPGLGLLLLESIQRRDYPLVQGAVLLIAVIYVAVNLITDLIYLLIHPKVQPL